jgi:hypothetical protein
VNRAPLKAHEALKAAKKKTMDAKTNLIVDMANLQVKIATYEM